MAFFLSLQRAAGRRVLQPSFITKRSSIFRNQRFAIATSTSEKQDISLETCFSSDETDPTPVTTYLNNPKYNKFTCNRLEFLGNFNRLISIDDPHTAQTLLINFRKNDGIIELNHLNSLLASWVKIKDLSNAELVYNDLISTEFKPDYYTFMCLARIYIEENLSNKLALLVDDMRKNGLDPIKLSLSSLLSEHERVQLHKLLPEAFLDPCNLPKPNQPSFSDRLQEQWRREANISVLLDAVLTKSELQRLAENAKSETSTLNDDVSKNKSQYSFEIWKQSLVDFLNSEKEDFLRSSKTLKSKDERTYMYGSVSIEDLADITLTELERSILSNEFGARVNHLSSEIGRNVFKRYFIVENHKRGINTHLKRLYAQYETYFSDLTLQKKYTHTEYWKELEKQLGDDVLGINEENIEPWTIQIILHVGASLINAVLNCASISKVPGYNGPDTAAFYHTYEYEGAKQIGHIRAHDFVHNLATSQISKSNKGEVITKRAYDALALPTLIPPRPWTSVRTGAYLLTPSNIMRCADDAFQHIALLANVNESLGEVFDALNYLSSCPWNINKKVYEVVRQLFVSEEGYEDLEIVPLSIPMPKKPEKDAMDQYYNLYRLAKQQCKDNLSQRSDLALKITIAENFKDQVFYFPHNMDFRGRTYTIPPHLNHLGMDLCRGLLKFAEKRPLGKRGLYWLKIHLANVYGQDKLSFDDRVKFTENNMQNIFDTADSPLNSKWWRKGESPWQILAVCQEIADAVRSPNPETFESGLPVHQDGTCNGLQHYAALGRDKEGAHHVNLDGHPDSDKPQDVYTAVAKRVTALVQMHANGDFSIPVPIGSLSKKEKQKFAEMLLAQGPIPRKVVKQTVMTTVYGVTMIGARDQILKQLKAQGNIPVDVVFDIANYLAKCVFVSLGHIFSSAQKIQTWFSETANIIASTGDPVTWITPLGLPIVQPYHTPRRKHLRTKLQSITISNSSNVLLAPKVAKQKNAFPPNFIHSLDSTHMMYTANACKQDGITFVAVHDSYWTHAATVDMMNVHTREQFVRLHSQPLLENLYQYYKRNYDGLKHKRASKVGDKPVIIEHYPELGDFDIQEIKTLLPISSPSKSLWMATAADTIVEVARICPLMLPEDDRGLAFSGYIEVSGVQWPLRLILSPSKRMNEARIESGWELHRILAKHSNLILGLLKGSSSPANFLQTLLTSLQSLLNESIVDFSFSLASQKIITDMEMVGWDNILDIDESLQMLKLQFVDPKGRAHPLIIHLSQHYPAIAPRFIVDLPEPLEIEWTRQSSLFMVYSLFKHHALQYQLLWDSFDELHEKSWILDPPINSRSILTRRIALGNNVSIQIKVDARNPTALPEFRYLGPDHAIASFNEKIGATVWNPKLSILSNLQAFFQQELPLPSAVSEGDNMACGICYTFRLGEEIPDKVCEQRRCGRCFHHSCLYEWLKTLPSTRQSFDTLFGECLYCEEPITCKVVLGLAK